MRTNVLQEIANQLSRTEELEREVDRQADTIINQQNVISRLEALVKQIREKCKVLEGAVEEDTLTPDVEEQVWALAPRIEIELLNTIKGERRIQLRINGKKPLRWKDGRSGHLGLSKVLRKAIEDAAASRPF